MRWLFVSCLSREVYRQLKMRRYQSGIKNKNTREIIGPSWHLTAWNEFLWPVTTTPYSPPRQASLLAINRRWQLILHNELKANTHNSLIKTNKIWLFPYSFRSQEWQKISKFHFYFVVQLSDGNMHQSSSSDLPTIVQKISEHNIRRVKTNNFY